MLVKILHRIKTEIVSDLVQGHDIYYDRFLRFYILMNKVIDLDPFILV